MSSNLTGMSKKMKEIKIKNAVEIEEGISNGTIKPECFYCKKNPCYEIIAIESVSVVATSILFDGERLVCKSCWRFMNTTGAWFTAIQRFVLKIICKFRRSNDKKLL